MKVNSSNGMLFSRLAQNDLSNVIDNTNKGFTLKSPRTLWHYALLPLHASIISCALSNLHAVLTLASICIHNSCLEENWVLHQVCNLTHDLHWHILWVILLRNSTMHDEKPHIKCKYTHSHETKGDAICSSREAWHSASQLIIYALTLMLSQLVLITKVRFALG